MTLTKVILNDGSEHIIKYHHSAIEEAAALGEITTSLEGKTVPLEEVSWWSPQRDSSFAQSTNTSSDE